MSGRILLLVLIIIIIHGTLEYQWRHDRSPKIMGDKIPFKAITPNRRKIQWKIIQYHNFFRTKVVPTASNMLRMKWHRGAARAAQKWAQKCLVLTHDSPAGRYIKNYGACGQNIFIATKKVPWLFAIKSWYLEKDNFTHGSDKNDINVVGHYTQMVWASTHEVGCGLSKCFFNNYGKTFYNYICNYCPIGNRPEQLGRPYHAGEPCEMCKGSCRAKKLCTNRCYVADLWSNCGDLYKQFPTWLCNRESPEGKQRLKHCRATCNCNNKIHV